MSANVDLTPRVEQLEIRMAQIRTGMMTAVAVFTLMSGGYYYMAQKSLDKLDTQNDHISTISGDVLVIKAEQLRATQDNDRFLKLVATLLKKQKIAANSDLDGDQ